MSSTYWPDADRVECPFDGGIDVAINDLMWSDTVGSLTLQNGKSSVQGRAYPADQMPDQFSEPANQAYFGPRFLGVAKEALSSGQQRSTILVDRVFVGPMTIGSGTYYQGDLVAACEQTNGTQLSNAKVKKTTTAADAIGFVLKDSGGPVTTVTVCLISRVLPRYMPLRSVVNTSGIEMDDGANIALNTTTGTKIGTATNQKLGFWNATPVTQPASGSQAATVMTAVASAVSATNSVVAAMAANSNAGEAWGFNTQASFNSFVAEIQALVADGAAMNTQIGALNTDVHALNTLVNRLRADLVTVGIIKGSA